MKTVLALIVAFLLIIATLQANAETLKVGERRLKAKRQLLNEATKVNRKLSVGATSTESKDQTAQAANQGTATSTETETDSNTNNDPDDVNPTYGNYGHATGTGSESHHYFTDDKSPGAKSDDKSKRY